jgi:hypothetical protein
MRTGYMRLSVLARQCRRGSGGRFRFPAWRGACQVPVRLSGLLARCQRPRHPDHVVRQRSWCGRIYGRGTLWEAPGGAGRAEVDQAVQRDARAGVS